MSGKRSIFLTLATVAVATVAFLVVYRKQVCIAYHNSCLRAAGRYLQVVNGPMVANQPSPRSSFLEDRLLRLCYRDNEDVGTSMKRHTQALLDISFFVREEFALENRPLDQISNRIAFYGQVKSEFHFGTAKGMKEDWWSMSGSMSNSVVITTTHAQMPRWKKLIEDFDQSDSKSEPESP